MIKKVPRTDRNAGSAKILKRRMAYLEDRDVDQHRGLIICPSANYNCSSDSAEDFEQRCLISHEEYLSSPERSRGGKPSKRIFEEFIYSSPEGAHMTALERKSAEMMLVNDFARHSAVRCGWHVNETSGRCDLHVLIAAKNSEWPARLTISSEFGNGKKNILTVINRVSQDIVDELNQAREKLDLSKLKSAREVYRERLAKKGKPSLAHEVAKAIGLKGKGKGNTLRTLRTLREVVESLGYEVTRDNDNFISVKFDGKKRAMRYNKQDLHDDISGFRQEIEKGLELSKKSKAKMLKAAGPDIEVS